MDWDAILNPRGVGGFVVMVKEHFCEQLDWCEDKEKGDEKYGVPDTAERLVALLNEVCRD